MSRPQILMNNTPFVSNGTAITSGSSLIPDFQVRGSIPNRTTIFVLADQAGDVQLYAINPRDNSQVAMGAVTSVTANTLETILVDFPIARIRVEYTNTNASPGNLDVWASAEGD